MHKNSYWQEHKKLWIAIILIVIVIKVFSLNSSRVEGLYSSGFYPFISRPLRFLFGWIPFSVGDILYFIGGAWLFWKLLKGIIFLFSKHITAKYFLQKTLSLIAGILIIYIIFNILWGVNYNRKGIMYQTGLARGIYDTSDLVTIQNLLVEKVNESKNALGNSNIGYPSKDEMFARAFNCYKDAEKTFPFLHYRTRSVKFSFYGWLGNYLGFTGYYNPFTGEAQVNTEVPLFLQPFITAHEMAHQLGYAKENEANFVGYLAAVNSDDTLFRYSAYFDLFLYANREVYFFDTLAANNALLQLTPEVISDLKELRQFDLAHQSPFEPAVSWAYSNYLKMNEQPHGIRSYYDVIGMLVAYYKKYGKI